MGTFLVTGIVQEIIVYKKETVANGGVLLEDLIKNLRFDINIEHYHMTEDEDRYYWKIKHELLEGNFVEFLDAQFKLYDAQPQIAQHTLDSVANAKTAGDRLDLAATKSFENFQLIGDLTKYIRMRTAMSFEQTITTRYNLIAFFMDGKISMECYNNILKYFEKNIRSQRVIYPVADCVKVMITN